jgi:hypothetical protein
MDNNSNQMAVKLAIVTTTNTPGWQNILAIAKSAVKQAENEVWACTDRERRNDLVLKAQAAREFFDTFLRTIEEAKLVDTELNESFVEVAY